MRIPVIRKWVVLVVISVVCSINSGCNRLNDKPGGEYLNLALAGMAGSDGVSFEGATALLSGSEGTSYASVYYGGEVEDHNKVTLYTLLPDKKLPKSASNKMKEASSATDEKSFFSRLEKKEGHWKVLSGSTVQQNNPLPGLNPLHQLEELKGLNKTVTEEAGGGKGVRILRIELFPEEAHKQLANQLNQEMAALRDKENIQVSNNPKAKAALDTFWKEKSDELKHKLDSAQVKTVYHLNVDIRRNLPKRLAWTRTINYPGDDKNTAAETYVSQVDFYGYR